MGKVVHLRKVLDFAKVTPVFRPRDVELIVKDRGYAHLLLHNLVGSGRLVRYFRGWYGLRDDPTLSVFTFKPAYLGLQEALSIRELWEQETVPVVITTLRVRTGIRSVAGGNLLVRHLAERYFFGYDFLKYGDFYVPVSDPEKTLIDFVYYNEAIGEEALEGLLKRANRAVLLKYLRPYPQALKRRVMRVFEGGASNGTGER